MQIRVKIAQNSSPNIVTRLGNRVFHQVDTKLAPIKHVSLTSILENEGRKTIVNASLFNGYYLTIRLRARVFYEQIVNETQPS